MAIGDWGFRAEFVGRENEFKQLQAHITKTIEGKGGVVFIEGEAGIGKTRLVDEVRTWCKEIGETVRFITGRCLYHEDVNPYLPFLDALREYAQTTSTDIEKPTIGVLDHTPQELEHVMPFGFVQSEDTLLSQQNECLELLPMSLIPMGAETFEEKEVPQAEKKEAIDREISELDINKERERMFRTITEILINISKEQPLVLILDDIHWADCASLQLLPYVADHTKNSPLLIACTYRPEDLEGFTAETHPLVETIQRMSRMGLFTKIKPERLSFEDTKCMVESLFDQKNLPKDFIMRIYKKTEGNPFYIEEVTRALIEEGIIDIRDHLWPTKINLADITIPGTVTDVILRRLGRLGTEALKILRLASVIGRAFHFAILQQASEMDEVELLDLVDMVLEARLIREDYSTDEEVYKFDNIAIREVVYKMLSRSRRRVLHKKVAEALERLYCDNLNAIVFELAHHFMAAKEYRRAVPYLIQAGEFAKASYAPDDAKAFFRRALEALQKTQEDEEVLHAKCNVHLRLGELSFITCEYDKAIDYYANSVAICKIRKDDHNIALSHRYLGHLYKEKGEWELAIENYYHAMVISERIKDYIGIADTQRGIGYVHWRRGELDKAIQYYNMSIDNSQKAGDISVLGLTFIEIGNIYADKSEWENATEFYEKAIEILTKVGDLNELARAYNNIGDLHLQTGEWDKAIDYFHKCKETSKKIGNISMVAWSSFNMAECYVNRDNIKLAEELVKEAYKILKELNEKIGIAAVYRIYAKIFQKKGEWELAEVNFQKSIKMLLKLDIPYELGTAKFDLGNLYNEQGRFDAAEKAYEAALDYFKKVGAIQSIERITTALQEIRGKVIR